MHLLVLGGNSEIGLALAHEFARHLGADVTLASRGMELLTKRAHDLALRHGVRAVAVPFDAMDTDSHQAFYAGLEHPPDVVVVAFGLLGDQKRAQEDFTLARQVLETNLVGAVSICEVVARDFEQRRGGTLIGLGSVAGLRGRRSNYIYGSAKAGFLCCLSGLRHRLYPSGGRVLAVLPGFVATKMTAHLDLPARLTASPEEVARDIRRAFEKRRDLVYSKPVWRLIMLVIRSIPGFLFKRTNL